MSATDSDKQRLDFDEVRRIATGRWRGILAALGIEVPDHPGAHGPCPGCGGTDRFRFDDKDGRGTFLCSGGGADLLAGDGFDLVQHALGCSARRALEMVAGTAGSIPATRHAPVRTHTRPSTGKRVYALELCAAAEFRDAAVAAHPYCERKKISHAFGAGVVDDKLVIPIRAGGIGRVIAVQIIWPNGNRKTYGGMTDPDGIPGYLLLGNDLRTDPRIYVVEGWADAWGCFLTWPTTTTATAFGKGRLDTVAEHMAHKFPDSEVCVIGDPE